MGKVIGYGTVLTIVWAFLCVLLTGCSLFVGAIGGGFNRPLYSSWETLYHDGEKYLISPHGPNEYFLKDYDVFLWGGLDHPRGLSVGSLFFRYKGFPYFSVYRKGVDSLFDVRKETEKTYIENEYRILLKIHYEKTKKAFVTVTNPRGKSKIFEMLLDGR